jgi:hypothetical protein
MASTVGWRNFWWLNVAILAFNTVTLVFLFPETKWHRVHPSELASSSPNDHGSDGSSNDKAHASLSNLNEIEVAVDDKNAPLPNFEPSAADPVDVYLGKGKPSKAQFRFWQPADSHTSWWIELFTPWKLFSFPIVQFASFVVSWSASCFLTVNLTQSQNFAAPPYNYSSTVVGTCPNSLLIDPKLIVDRILQLCSPDWHLHWPSYSWPALRLDLHETDHPQQWYP